MQEQLQTFVVKWTPELPALRHTVRTTTVKAVNKQEAGRTVANDYPAPILVQSVKEILS